MLAAARIAGVTEAYRIGGAQAVAALAYGTETIRRVDKIVGPGNIYVALAKSRVFGDVGHRHDRRAERGRRRRRRGTPIRRFVAADLLAQAEHDPMARAVLLTPSASLIDRASQAALDAPARALPRRAIAARALAANGALVLTASLEDAVDAGQRLAPEHLELLVAEPGRAAAAGAERAGAVFLGAHTPEVVGDYVAGPEPRAADRRHRALRLGALHRGLREALERDRVLAPGGLAEALPHLDELARVEGLDGHGAAAAELRIGERRERMKR